MDNTRKRATPAEYDDLEMSVLFQISKAVAQRKEVSALISQTLEILDREMGLVRGTITLRDGDYLFIEASHGLDDESIRKGVYKMGEGVTGKVAQTAKSIAVADISKSPDFLDRTKARGRDLEGIAFVCVPIVYIDHVIGTLSIDRRLPSPGDLERDVELLETIANILADAVSLIYTRDEERDRLMSENRRLKLELGAGLSRPKEILGNCGAMQSVYEAVAKFSASTCPVFIRGKSGTGKELVARAIAARTKGFDTNFRVVNCAALPDMSLLGEVFGFEAGAFANAHTPKRGILEECEGGTVFFDEVAEMCQACQRAMADFLRTGCFRRLGGDRRQKARVRIICASCDDIEKLSEENRFDKSLYKILSANTIHLPTLKDRKSDILLLAEHFLEKYSALYHKDIKRISTPAINMLTIYSWPGNVRELESCIERAVISSHDSAISGYNLPNAVRAGYSQRTLPYGEDVDFKSMTESFERELITEALKAERGNAAAAARRLKISQRIINYKIAKYSITASWYKSAK